MDVFRPVTVTVLSAHMPDNSIRVLCPLSYSNGYLHMHRVLYSKGAARLHPLSCNLVRLDHCGYGQSIRTWPRMPENSILVRSLFDSVCHLHMHRDLYSKCAAARKWVLCSCSLVRQNHSWNGQSIRMMSEHVSAPVSVMSELVSAPVSALALAPRRKWTHHF